MTLERKYSTIQTLVIGGEQQQLRSVAVCNKSFDSSALQIVLFVPEVDRIQRGGEVDNEVVVLVVVLGESRQRKHVLRGIERLIGDGQETRSHRGEILTETDELCPVLALPVEEDFGRGEAVRIAIGFRNNPRIGEQELLVRQTRLRHRCVIMETRGVVGIGVGTSEKLRRVLREALQCQRIAIDQRPEPLVGDVVEIAIGAVVDVIQVAGVAQGNHVVDD